MNKAEIASYKLPSRFYWIPLVLAVIILVLYGRVVNHEFLDYDDVHFIVENPNIQTGLNWESVQYALSSELVFTSIHQDYWQPVTVLARIIDVQLFGLNPAGHHLMNVVFHILNTLLILNLFYRMTGKIWQSTFIALFFAVHPLQVEVVAWITQRKDLLATFFGLLAMTGYLDYVKATETGKSGFVRRLYYWPIVFFFALAMMSKTLAATFPFLLLLLDWWPLGRIEPTKEKWKLLIFEKIPLIIISGALAGISFIGQPGALYYPFKLLCISVVTQYMRYLGMIFNPQNLRFYAPHFLSNFVWTDAIAPCLALFVITTLVILMRNKRPYLFVGWFWYVICLIPMIGLYAPADRFMYVPIVGIIVAVVGFISDTFKNRYDKISFCLIALILCSFYIGRSWVQVGYWKDTTTLFDQTLKYGNTNEIIHSDAGLLYLRQGRDNEALGQKILAGVIHEEHAKSLRQARAERQKIAEFFGIRPVQQ